MWDSLASAIGPALVQDLVPHAPLLRLQLHGTQAPPEKLHTRKLRGAVLHSQVQVPQGCQDCALRVRSSRAVEQGAQVQEFGTVGDDKL